MAKQKGITRFTCDRCNTVEYLPEGDPHIDEWREVQHITADGTQNTRLLCKSCHPTWHAFAIQQDNEFNQFMLQKDRDKEDKTHDR